MAAEAFAAEFAALEDPLDGEQGVGGVGRGVGRRSVGGPGDAGEERCGSDGEGES